MHNPFLQIFNSSGNSVQLWASILFRVGHRLLGRVHRCLRHILGYCQLDVLVGLRENHERFEVFTCITGHRKHTYDIRSSRCYVLHSLGRGSSSQRRCVVVGSLVSHSWDLDDSYADSFDVGRDLRNDPLVDYAYWHTRSIHHGVIFKSYRSPQRITDISFVILTISS